MKTPTIDEQIAELERIIRILHRIYDRQVRERRMTDAQAIRGLSCMGAALDTLQTVRRLEKVW